MNPDVKKAYLNRIDPSFQSIVIVLTKTIESADKKLECDIKWGRLTYGLSGDYHHWICGIAQTKKSINLIFHFGGILEDKHKRLMASGSFFFRKLEYSTAGEIEEKVITDFVKQAVGKLVYFKNNWKELNKRSKQRN